ncbi:MAG: response regulator transcription factor [Epsilonproteobacteria bacterium]|nr:response regulator transcription factor [Campylobacterota bacterium]
MDSYEVLKILSDKKVLYAEDEEGIRKNVAETLGLFFKKVVAVGDGVEALYEMTLSSYDILIFDICLPNMDGLEAIRNIRKKDKKIPIIILSAHTEQEYLWRAVELKITRYLTKPFDKTSFIDTLKEAALELVDSNLEIKLKDGCIYNPCTKAVICKDKDIQLSKSESRLLEFFIKRENQTVTFEQIYDYIWEFEQPSKEAIKSLIKELRRKVAKECIKSVYGIGYKFEIQ